MNAPTLLRETGQALFGRRWQSDLARELGMSDRHMRRLVAGDAEITPGTLAELRKVATARRSALDAIISRLGKVGG